MILVSGSGEGVWLGCFGHVQCQEGRLMYPPWKWTLAFGATAVVKNIPVISGTKSSGVHINMLSNLKGMCAVATTFLMSVITWWLIPDVLQRLANVNTPLCEYIGQARQSVDFGAGADGTQFTPVDMTYLFPVESKPSGRTQPSRWIAEEAAEAANPSWCDSLPVNSWKNLIIYSHKTWTHAWNLVCFDSCSLWAHSMLFSSQETISTSLLTHKHQNHFSTPWWKNGLSQSEKKDITSLAARIEMIWWYFFPGCVHRALAWAQISLTGASWPRSHHNSKRLTI